MLPQTSANEKFFLIAVCSYFLVTTQVGLPYSYYDETIAA